MTPSAAEAWVVAETGTAAGKLWRVDDRTIRLGRGIDASIALIGEGTIARHHAEIWWHEGAHLIRDLESTNGTIINGVRIAGTATLRDNTAFTAGTTTLRYFVGAEAEGRAHERALWIKANDPITKLPRKTPASAVRIRIYGDELVRGFGFLGSERIYREVGRRLRAIAPREIEVTAPSPYELAIAPPGPPGYPQTLVDAIVVEPIVIDGRRVEIRLEVVATSAPPA